MRNKTLQTRRAALGGYTIEGPYTRSRTESVRRALRAKLAALLAVIVAACGQAHGDAGAKASEPAPAASICQHYDPLRGFAQANIACVH